MHLLVRAGFRGKRPLLWPGIGVCVAPLALFSVMSLWGEAPWSLPVGYGIRSWPLLAAEAASAATGAIAALGLVFLINTRRRLTPLIHPWAELAGAAGGTLWGGAGGSEAIGLQ